MLQAEADDDAQKELDKVVFSEATCCGCTRFAWDNLCFYSFAWFFFFTGLWLVGTAVVTARFDWCVWWDYDGKKRQLRRCGRHEYWLKAPTMFYSVWKSTSASGAPDNSSLSHFPAMTRPSWLGRAARNWHRHAIEPASRRWRGGRCDASARTRRKILISTQVNGRRRARHERGPR